jgi:methionyl aminopeptidase
MTPREGVRFSVIGDAVAEVAAAGKYGIVTNFFGHGIGRDMHQPPMVAHYPNDMDDEMRPGMVFTIEPMLTEGRPDNHMWDDGWSVVADDGGLSSQHEEVVAIHTDGRVEVLTKNYPDGWDLAWGPLEPL